MADENKVEQTPDSGTEPSTPAKTIREMKAQATGSPAPVEPAAPEAPAVVEAAAADTGMTDMRRAHQAAMKAQPPAPKPEPKPTKAHEPMSNTTTLFGRTIP